MKISVNPYAYNDHSTSSILKVNGEFECFTLEDKFRQDGKKVYGETCIPAGNYKIILRNQGGMNSKYKKRMDLRDFHEGMLWLQDVENFEWIYIHIGNFTSQTLGCILVGNQPNPKRDYVGNSADAYIRLYKKILSARLRGESISIRVHR